MAGGVFSFELGGWHCEELRLLRRAPRLSLLAPRNDGG